MANEANDLKEEGLRLFRDGVYQEALEQFDLAQKAFGKGGQPTKKIKNIIFHNRHLLSRLLGQLLDLLL